MKPNRSKLVMIGTMAMGLAAAIAPQSQAEPSNSNVQQQTKTREAIQIKIQTPRPIEQRLNLTNGGAGNDAGRILNQRQYRKWARQNPQMRRSKKFRIKS